jgi:hypothetical protein
MIIRQARIVRRSGSDAGTPVHPSVPSAIDMAMPHLTLRPGCGPSPKVRFEGDATRIDGLVSLATDAVSDSTADKEITQTDHIDPAAGRLLDETGGEPGDCDA